MFVSLPNAPDVLVEDRFSLLDSDEDLVPLWDLLQHLLSRDIKETRDLVDLLDTLHCTIGHDYGSDYGFLVQFIRQQENELEFFSRVWPMLVKVALDAPQLFPEGRLSVLEEPKASLLSLSRHQCACLIAHQFLCSFPHPSWYPEDRSHDFHIWYKDDQPHANVVKAYLTSVFAYFRLEPFPEPDEVSVRFLLASADPKFEAEAYNSTVPLQTPQYTESTEAYFPTAKLSGVDGIYNTVEVVSANKDIGFGRSGTQEEILAGTSPEACPAVLFTATLKPNQVLIVEGALAMASVIGYNRTARLEQVECFPERGCKGWNRRTLLFMDALELDSYDGTTCVPDLLPGHVSRELMKAFAAFSSYVKLQRSDPYGCVVTPLWGCGAFCGDPQIKILLMLCSSTFSGNKRFHIFTAKDRKSISAELKELVNFLEEHRIQVGFILNTLAAMSPSETINSRNAFEYVKRKFLESE